MQYDKGHYYHIYNRGNNRQNIFLSEDNYLYLLELIQKNRDKFDMGIIAYCLMPNHYHFLVRQDSDTPINQFLKSTFQSYVQAFNKKNKRTGQIFEGNPKSVHIAETDYLFQLTRYIHLNPVDAGLCLSPAKWEYSNYPEFIGRRNGTLFDEQFFKDNFKSPKEYESFVIDYLDEKNRYKTIAEYIFE